MEKAETTSLVTEEYRDAVTQLAINKEERRFLNDSCDHAKLLAELMIGKSLSDDKVEIYSGELGRNCFTDALLSSKASIRILLDSNNGVAVINGLPDEVRDRIEFRLVNAPCANHFFVSGNSFRYEKDHCDSTAVANFNEPETVTKLSNLFNIMWEQAIAV